MTDKTIKLIDEFWLELDRIGGRQRIQQRDEGICQCQTTWFFEDSENPPEMLSFFMMGSLIDQIMYTYFQEIYTDFRIVFKYPKLWNHGGGGCAHPSWFFYRNSEVVDWESVRTVFKTLIKDTRNWFVEDDKNRDFKKFEKWLGDELKAFKRNIGIGKYYSSKSIRDQQLMIGEAKKNLNELLAKEISR